MNTLFTTALVLALSLGFFAVNCKASTPRASPAKCIAVGEGLEGTSAGKTDTPENVCCSGLKESTPKEACGQPIGGYAGICLACGDGRCDLKLENACNCAPDCAAK